MLNVGYCINSRMVNSIDQYLPVFSSICRYLPVNTAGMENTHICRHFANLALKDPKIPYYKTFNTNFPMHYIGMRDGRKKKKVKRRQNKFQHSVFFPSHNIFQPSVGDTKFDDSGSHRS